MQSPLTIIVVHLFIMLCSIVSARSRRKIDNSPSRCPCAICMDEAVQKKKRPLLVPYVVPYATLRTRSPAVSILQAVDSSIGLIAFCSCRSFFVVVVHIQTHLYPHFIFCVRAFSRFLFKLTPFPSFSLFFFVFVLSFILSPHSLLPPRCVLSLSF
jgi:hypothetical protein